MINLQFSVFWLKNLAWNMGSPYVSPRVRQDEKTQVADHIELQLCQFNVQKMSNKPIKIW